MGSSSDPQTLHKYLYTHADPVNNIDPSGNITFSGILASTKIQNTLTAISAGGIGISVADFFLSDQSIETRAKDLGQNVLLSLMPGSLFKVLEKTGAVKYINVQGKTFSRVMSKEEVQAVLDTKFLRENRPGLTYFTDQKFKSASKASNSLSLPETPSHRLDFKVKNNPKTIRRNKAHAKYGHKGGGQELFTSDTVHVEILNYQKLKP